MENNINDIIGKALIANNKEYNNKNIHNLLNSIKESILNNKQIFYQANDIDNKNDNGVILDFKIFENIFNLVLKEKIMYGDVIKSVKDENNKIIYGKQLSNLGLVTIITDGNPYITLEMILRNILAYNSIILCNNGKSYGLNNLIVEIVKSNLKKYNYDENLVNLYITDDYNKLLKNFASINKVICIGSHDLQQIVLRQAQNSVILSGYENYELYIESIDNIEFINKIIETNLNIQVYIRKDINIKIEDSIEVVDVDEAISLINYNGSGYSTSIFTNDKNNASKFLHDVNSKIVTFNTSPTIERICDIKQQDLMIEKTMIYPI